MKVINCAKCNEEYAIDLNKPEEWHCPYCDNLYSITTDKLSVEKLQEQLNSAKKALTEIAEFEPKKSAHKYWPDWHSIMMATASDALAAIGGDDESLDN